MKVSEKIKTLCEERKISFAELAKRMGQSPDIFEEKIKREALSQEDMRQIADEFGVIFEHTFLEGSIEEEVNMIAKHETEELMAEKYISEELGVSIASTDNEENVSSDGWIKLNDPTVAKINAVFQSAPHFIAELSAEQMLEPIDFNHLELIEKNQ